MNLKGFFSFVGKLGGATVAGLGVSSHSMEETSIGAAAAVLIHFIDSVWNSAKSDQPTP